MMMNAFRALSLTLSLTLLFCAGPVAAQTSDAAPDPTARVDAALAPWTGDATPGCAIAVEQGGRQVLSRAWGQADLEHGVAATDQTIYEAGSVSKQFVAAAVVMLALDGKLSLDDDVRRYLPEMPDYGAPITLRMMLNHTSGLRDWGSIVGVEGWPRGTRYMTNDRVLAVVARQTALNHAPGAEVIYSNSNYNLLAIVIERVSGQSLQAFTDARIFQPVGMIHSRWRDDYAAVVPGRAIAYARDGEGRWRADMPLEDAHGNGGLLTTVGDMMLWNHALDEARFGPDFMREMLRPGVLNDGRSIQYASGLFLMGEPGRREISHSGSTAGYRAWLGRFPDQHLAVALLCNAADVNSTTLSRQVAVAFAPELALTSLPGVLPPTGLFASEKQGAPLTLVVADGVARVEGGEILVAVTPDRFRLGGDELIFDGPDRFVRINTLGQRVRFSRVTPSAPTAETLAALVGDWRSDEALATVGIRPTGAGGLEIIFPNAPAMPLTPSHGQVFVFPLGHVTVDGDVLRISVDRARNIAFRRAD